MGLHIPVQDTNRIVEKQKKYVWSVPQNLLPGHRIFHVVVGPWLTMLQQGKIDAALSERGRIGLSANRGKCTGIIQLYTTDPFVGTAAEKSRECKCNRGDTCPMRTAANTDSNCAMCLDRVLVLNCKNLPYRFSSFLKKDNFSFVMQKASESS